MDEEAGILAECLQRQLDEITFISAMFDLDYSSATTTGSEAQFEAVMENAREALAAGTYGEEIVREVNDGEKEGMVPRTSSSPSETKKTSSPVKRPGPQRRLVPLLQFGVIVTEMVPGINQQTGVLVEDAVRLRCTLEFVLPRKYPLCPHTAIPELHLDGSSNFEKFERDEVLRALNCVKEEYQSGCGSGEIVQPLVEAARSTLCDIRRQAAEETLEWEKEQEMLQAALDASWTSQLELDTTLGRRAIYSHHILCIGKRQCINHWAKKLRLNGFCKIGYPGILIVEGPEVGCVQYVAWLQRLRWKFLVVRGEEQIDVRTLQPAACSAANMKKQSVKGEKEGKAGHLQQDNEEAFYEVNPAHQTAIDAYRRIPNHGVIEMIDSSEIAQRCKAVGLESLFLTSMKIFK